MGIGAEISAFLAEELFESLDAPIVRVAAADCHVPSAPALEEQIIPNVQSVVDALAAPGRVLRNWAMRITDDHAAAWRVGVEGVILRWLKREGESIARDEPLLEVMTDKVNAELPATEAGTLLRIVARRARRCRWARQSPRWSWRARAQRPRAAGGRRQPRRCLSPTMSATERRPASTQRGREMRQALAAEPVAGGGQIRRSR